jgi:uncharacterized BrkB/YihY/UPF0761 family membrane protein
VRDEAAEAKAAAEAGDRGRRAGTPTDIPAKGWLDIAWRVVKGIQEDRALLVASSVTFYALLALFPAIAALVSLYGLFNNPATISEHFALLSGFLPQGALEVIRDQVKRISAQRQGTLSVTFIGTLLLSLWGANAATKAYLRRAQHHLQGEGTAGIHTDLWRKHTKLVARHRSLSWLQWGAWTSR